jgi:hypothetical protein
MVARQVSANDQDRQLKAGQQISHLMNSAKVTSVKKNNTIIFKSHTPIITLQKLESKNPPGQTQADFRPDKKPDWRVF